MELLCDCWSADAASCGCLNVYLAFKNEHPCILYIFSGLRRYSKVHLKENACHDIHGDLSLDTAGKTCNIHQKKRTGKAGKERLYWDCDKFWHSTLQNFVYTFTLTVAQEAKEYIFMLQRIHNDWARDSTRSYMKQIQFFWAMVCYLRHAQFESLSLWVFCCLSLSSVDLLGSVTGTWDCGSIPAKAKIGILAIGIVPPGTGLWLLSSWSGVLWLALELSFISERMSERLSKSSTVLDTGKKLFWLPVFSTCTGCVAACGTFREAAELTTAVSRDHFSIVDPWHSASTSDRAGSTMYWGVRLYRETSLISVWKTALQQDCQDSWLVENGIASSTMKVNNRHVEEEALVLAYCDSSWSQW